MRIKNHPILAFVDQKEIPFVFEGKSYIGYEGDTIASAMVDHGIVTFGYSIKRNRNRGFYCAIGNCASCNMIVDGVANVRTCITPLKANMIIARQTNKGEIK
jgi:hypothetical protein